MNKSPTNTGATIGYVSRSAAKGVFHTRPCKGMTSGRFFCVVLVFIATGCTQKPVSKPDVMPIAVSDFASLIQRNSHDVEELDIATANLLCAQGLPGAEQLDLTSSLATIDRMAARVRSETERHLYRFRNNPSDFENSVGFFRMIMLMVVLTEDFEVHYGSNRMASAASAMTIDGFFADSRYVFLHGLTGAKPEGTCSSLPVLQVAVGRRLGYPLKLVTTKGHLFVRWEDAKERFNFEAAGHAANRFSDDYYWHWPFEVTDEEVKSEGYLKSLTPAEELAVFLSIRGMCQRETGRFTEAADSFREAARLWPTCRGFQLMKAQMETEMKQRASRLTEAGVAHK
jgi:hypothetical protein